jgi:mannan endo-1,4-beta-mannosidase
MKVFFTFCLCWITVAHCQAQIFEAEKGALSGTQISTQRQGYSGTGFVTGFDADNDKVTMTVEANQGIYNVYIRYAAPFGEKFNFVYVNEANLGSVQFTASNTFAETRVGKVFLNKGSNTIAIVKEWGYFELDNIRLEPSEYSEIDHVAPELVVPNPSENTVALYNFLCKTYGKVILSGQYGGETEFNKIKSASGKTPLIRGFDLIDYSPSRVANGASSTETEKAIAWNGQKGIVTFAWHWNAPKDLIDQPNKEWWRGFYTEATTFDVTKAMNDNTSEEYELILRDIDAIAIQLKKLKDANVPVLWRPLHEAEGAWFWWGAKGPEACKWLWKLVYDRLVQHHQLNNLIWIWTSTASTAAQDWYPGDAYVDIIGADIYLPGGNYGSNLIMFDNLASLFGGKKIITLSENGPIPDAEQLFLERSAWNWFCTWSGAFITDGVSNSTSHINTVYNHEYVITLDELDDIDNIISALEERRKELDEENILGTEEDLFTLIEFQNPVKNDPLVIRSGNEGISAIAIFNAQGQLVFKDQNQDRKKMEFKFDFNDKSGGLYLLKVVTPAFTKIYRIVKI